MNEADIDSTPSQLENDGHDALIAQGLILEMFGASDRRGNLAPLKALRELVLSAYMHALKEDADAVSRPSARQWLSSSALAPVLAEYMFVALAGFKPEKGPAKSVRAAFADAFGVRFGQGAEPMMDQERLDLARVFNEALRPFGAAFDDDSLAAAYEAAFKKWKGRDYNSTEDGHDMRSLKTHLARELLWLDEKRTHSIAETNRHIQFSDASTGNGKTSALFNTPQLPKGTKHDRKIAPAE